MNFQPQEMMHINLLPRILLHSRILFTCTQIKDTTDVSLFKRLPSLYLIYIWRSNLNLSICNSCRHEQLKWHIIDLDVRGSNPLSRILLVLKKSIYESWPIQENSIDATNFLTSSISGFVSFQYFQRYNEGILRQIRVNHPMENICSAIIRTRCKQRIWSMEGYICDIFFVEAAQIFKDKNMTKLTSTDSRKEITKKTSRLWAKYLRTL